MNTLLLDTNIVSFFFKGHSLAKRYKLLVKGHLLVVSFVTIGELYEGVFRASWSQQRLSRLQALIDDYLVLDSSPDIAQAWGEIRYERRAQTISENDGWIAATARSHGFPLVTHNPMDFAGISGLKIITEHK